MKNLKIGKKLFLTFSTITALLIVNVIVSIISLMNISSSFSGFYQKSFPVSSTASELRTHIQAFCKDIGYSIMTNDEQKVQEYLADARNRFSSMDEGIVFMLENFDDEALVNEVDLTMKSVEKQRDQVLQMLAEDHLKASELYFSEVMPALAEANELLIQINNEAVEIADDDYLASMSRKETAMFILLAVSAAALAATVLLAFYVTRWLTKPIEEVEEAAQEMAEGNLKIDLQYVSRDELGRMADNMRFMSKKISYYMGELTDAMKQLASGDLNVKKREDFLGDFRPAQTAIRSLVESLNRAFWQISQVAEEVTSSARQVSSGTQMLSQGAAEQSSSVEELANAVSEISWKVKHNAQSAQDARQKVAETEEQIMQSNKSMQEMMQAMNEIAAASQDIRKIIKTQEDFAFQTNILALNASVEAARAGSAGNGFAVVANEVRLLANKSSEASKNTASLVENALRSVENGAQIAHKTEKDLLSAVDGTKIIMEMIDQISQASEQQAGSIMQVTQEIEEISNVVQANTATSEESAAASEELAGLAQVLKDLVRQVKLKNT